MSGLDHQDADTWEYSQDADQLAAPKVRRLDHLSTQELEAQLMGESTHPADDKERHGNESLGRAIAECDMAPPDAQCQAMTSQAAARRRRSAYYVTAIDLHHMSVALALKVLEAEMDVLLRRHRRVKLKVITGRGRHSPRGPQIAQQAHALVLTKFKSAIVKIGQCPTASMINNVALKGYFDVELQGYRR